MFVLCTKTVHLHGNKEFTKGHVYIATEKKSGSEFTVPSDADKIEVFPALYFNQHFKPIIAEVVEPATQPDVCPAWGGLDAECAYFGVCNCTAKPCVNKRVAKE
jgi:hypothetical protein